MQPLRKVEKKIHSTKISRNFGSSRKTFFKHKRYALLKFNQGTCTGSISLRRTFFLKPQPCGNAELARRRMYAKFFVVVVFYVERRIFSEMRILELLFFYNIQPLSHFFQMRKQSFSLRSFFQAYSFDNKPSRSYNQ